MKTEESLAKRIKGVFDYIINENNLTDKERTDKCARMAIFLIATELQTECDWDEVFHLI
jgi:hypothetical protein